MEEDLNKLHNKVKYLEEIVNNQDHKPTPDENHTPIIVETGSRVQQRSNANTKEFFFNSSGLEDFLISDTDNDFIKWKLVELINNNLPTKAGVVELVENVFENYAHEFYLVDYVSFMSQLDHMYLYFDSIKANDIKRTEMLNKQVKRSTLCYFFILLAYGEQIKNRTNTKGEIPGIQYYLMAAELFNLTQEVIRIEFIQCATLLALYSANLNRYNTVYNYFGVAVRSAVCQGFHRQQIVDESDRYALIFKEKAKRLWWTIFVTDGTWRSKMNMPAQIDYTETDVDLPGENSIDLNDSFDVHMLELNVHLAKFISKSVQKIYGANKRTFSVNYINTDQFNQKELIKNVLHCFQELIMYFETPYLLTFKDRNIIEPNGRKLMNLFLRFNLLIATLTKPLISLIFKQSDVNIFEDPIEVEEAINKTITTASATFNIIFKLYEMDRLFVIGFYDSEYLYTAIVIMIMTSITDPKCLHSVDRGVALLRYMADNGNINAKNCIQKLSQVNDFLSKTPEISFRINFHADIKDLLQHKPFDYDTDYYNPYQKGSNSSVSEFKIFKNNHGKKTRLPGNTNHSITADMQTSIMNPPIDIGGLIMASNTNDNELFEQEYLQDTNNRVWNLSGTSQNTLHSMMNNLYNWDDYKNLSF